MMASLTTQLRLGVGSWHGDRDKMREAADRIEALEAALRKIAGFNFPSVTPGYIAREALGEPTNDA